MTPGERIATIGMFVWICIGVGPWWIGLLLLGAGWAANMLIVPAPAKGGEMNEEQRKAWDILEDDAMRQMSMAATDSRFPLIVAAGCEMRRLRAEMKKEYCGVCGQLNWGPVQCCNEQHTAEPVTKETAKYIRRLRAG